MGTMKVAMSNTAMESADIIMKPRLPHRLTQALLTTCAAALSSTTVFADEPEGYTSVVITEASALYKYSNTSGKYAFLLAADIINSTHMKCSYEYWSNEQPDYQHFLTFSGISATNKGGAITASVLTMKEFRELMFSACASSDRSNGGGAIYSADIGILQNETVELSSNHAFSKGGAIQSTNTTISNSNELIIRNNYVSNTEGYYSKGGAIYTTQELAITNNKETTFDNNSAYSYLYHGGYDTGSTYSGGGAIWCSETNCIITLTGNECLTFKDNNASTLCVNPGGRSYAYSWGGAVYADNLVIKNNGDVTFCGNYTKVSSSDPYSYGGAIFATDITITNNNDVLLRGNYASSIYEAGIEQTYASNPIGGAIYGKGKITISGNALTEFRGNYEKIVSGSTTLYRLRGLYMAGSGLTLAAGKGQTIAFYDALCVAGNATISFNADYKDKDGEFQKATGDIVFSALHTEEDLGALKANYTQNELTNSLTTVVHSTTNLYGGRMRIEDGAIYKGYGINVAAESAATLRLDNGTLNQTGYNVEMSAGATLDLEGENNITATSLKMMDGSTLSFNLGPQEGALLNLNGILNTGKITIALSGDMQNAHELINLADESQYDTSMWTEQRIDVTGTNFKHLVWNNGILSYAGIIESHIELDNDKEIADFDGGDIVDIEGNKHKLTVKHPVDLIHLAMKDGVVKLEGADNNVVRITLTENGTLELAAGAGLNVGNIVSMVANGSADLEISGDVEISDIKAYGKPGNKGTLSYVNITTKGDYTIEDMTITGSVIKVGENTTLYLVNVDIKSSSHITDDPAWVYAQGANIQLDKTNTWVDKEITAAQDTLLYMCGDTQQAITLAVGSEIVELTSSMFDTVTLTGTDLWLDMTGIAEATYGKDYFTLDFQDLARKMAKAQVDVENLHVYATLDGEKYTEAYSTANGGLTTTLYFQVPEPSTGTLSLLALAALAARRRR